MTQQQPHTLCCSAFIDGNSDWEHEKESTRGKGSTSHSQELNKGLAGMYRSPCRCVPWCSHDKGSLQSAHGWSAVVRFRVSRNGSTFPGDRSCMAAQTLKI